MKELREVPLKAGGSNRDLAHAALPEGAALVERTGRGLLRLAGKDPVGMLNAILTNIVPAERYTLSGRGKGGFLGLAEGAADIVLTDHGPDTLLVFTAEGGASGQIMSLGKAIIGNSAQKIIDGFFERFGTAMGAGVTPLPPEAPLPS